MNDPSGGREPWTVEEFYFGLMEFGTYRHRGDRVQYMEERGVSLAQIPDSPHFVAGVRPEMAELLVSPYEDAQIVTAPERTTNSGETVAPVAWITAWVDLKPDERHYYEKAKEHSMGAPKVWTMPYRGQPAS